MTCYEKCMAQWNQVNFQKKKTRIQNKKLATKTKDYVFCISEKGVPY